MPRVTLTCGEYLGNSIPDEICANIKRAIIRKLCEIEEGSFVPRYKEFFPRKGTVVIVCEDKDSESWLVKEAANLDLGDPNLKVRVVTPEELRVTKVITWVPSGFESVPQFLKLARIQNKEVDTAKWAVLKKTDEGCLILGLDEPSLATLQSKNFRLSVGLDTVTFKVLGKDKTKEAKGGAQKEAQ